MLTRHPLCLVCCGGKIVVLGPCDRRDAGIAYQRDKTSESCRMLGVELMFRRRKPGRWSENFGNLHCGVWKRCKEASEKGLHCLNDQMKVAFKLEAVGYEECLEELAKMDVDAPGSV